METHNRFTTHFIPNHVSVVTSDHTTNLSLIFQKRTNIEISYAKQVYANPPTPPDKNGEEDHNFYKERKRRISVILIFLAPFAQNLFLWLILFKMEYFILYNFKFYSFRHRRSFNPLFGYFKPLL